MGEARETTVGEEVYGRADVGLGSVSIVIVDEKE